MSMNPKAADELESKSSAASEPEIQTTGEVKSVKVEEKETVADKDEEQVGMEIDPNTGTSFPVKLEDGKQLNCVGLRKKSMLGFDIKIYSFGMYADNEKLRDLLKSSFSDSPEKPTKEMYQKVIDSDVGITVRLVIMLPSIPAAMMRSPDMELGAAIKKLGGGKEEKKLTKRSMGEATDNMKLTHGSVIETSRLPGYTLQTKVKGEVVSMIKSELLCRAYIYMYLGDEVLDKDAKDKFGTSMLKLL
ncbi:fatty-acid-binding protein 1-like [Punica granatum]|uniref:Fatty-acid-binding protein 1-like n=1 Tax=Punica granatum TaxID=22663 RepID=A0A218WFC0_PUNGR|nr:fatty-acid-binding protein 1-like [Punica granatum]OWM71505.1 hypothetical protein CDL15_Pgr005692 [Punica granatum]